MLVDGSTLDSSATSPDTAVPGIYTLHNYRLQRREEIFAPALHLKESRSGFGGFSNFWQCERIAITFVAPPDEELP